MTSSRNRRFRVTAGLPIRWWGGRLRRHALLVVCACCWVAGLRAGAESALEAAARLRAAGRLDAALDTLRLESRAVKQKEGDKSPKLLPINDLASEILIEKGDLETARTLLGKTTAMRQKLIAIGSSDQAAPLGESLLVLSGLESGAKRFPEAIAATRQAIVVLDGAPARDEAAVIRAGEALAKAVDLLEELLGAGADKVIQARAEASATFASVGMYAEAIAERQRMLEALRERSDREDPDVVDATTRLARLMVAAGQAAEAVPVVEASLDALGPDQPQEALALKRVLADVQLAADRLVLAEGTSNAIFEATKAEAKPSPVVMAADRLRCLLVRMRRGVVTDVPEWFGSELKIVSRPPLEERGEGVAGLATAGAVLEASGQPQAAADALGRALELATAAKTPDAARVADLSGRLVAAQLLTGSVAAARKTLDRALPIALRDVGTGDASVASLRVLRADTVERQAAAIKQKEPREKLRDEAVRVANEALVRGLPRPDEAWEAWATEVYDRLAAAGGGDLRERYVAARARQFGATHAHVATACGLFGAARLAAGDWPAAVDFYRRAAEIQRSSLGDDHPDTAASEVLLAHAQRAAGDAKQAVETATRALATWEQMAGPDHPGTLAAIDVLVAAKLDAGDATGVTDLLDRLCAAGVVDDPARHAAHLVRLADITASNDGPRSRALLEQALELPCWKVASIERNRRWRLALTAALAAHAFQVVGDAAGADAALQQARALAMQQADDPKPLLDRIDEIGAHGDRPTSRP